MAKELTNETKKDEDLLGGDKGILSDQSFIPGNGGLISTNIPKAGDFLDYTVGALTNARLKTYFNIQLLFILWTGAVINDTTTTFTNWTRSLTDVFITPGGSMADFRGTGLDSLGIDPPFFLTAASINLTFASTNIVILDWWARLPATGTDDIGMGFAEDAAGNTVSYNATTVNRVAIAQDITDAKIYATISKSGTGVTNTEITGVTVTNWNNYRIELHLGTDAKFYVNSVLKATLSGANLSKVGSLAISFGRKNTALFQVTAPYLSLEMNP